MDMDVVSVYAYLYVFPIWIVFSDFLKFDS